VRNLHRAVGVVILIGGGLFVAISSPAQNVTISQPVKLSDEAGSHGNLADQTRYHGFPLNATHDLMVEEISGCATITLRVKERAPGGPAEYYNPKTGESESTIRVRAFHDLAKICVEVIKPGAPNYVRNPGERYLITIQGIEAAPEYSHVFETDAASVLDAIYADIEKIIQAKDDVQRDGLYWGALMAMKVLNEAGYLPAQLSLTTKKSKVGQFRIQGPGLSRGKQPRVQRFAAAEAGGEYAHSLTGTLTSSPVPQGKTTNVYVERGALVSKRSLRGAHRTIESPKRTIHAPVANYPVINAQREIRERAPRTPVAPAGSQGATQSERPLASLSNNR